MVQKILFGLFIASIIFVTLVLKQPNDFRYTRTMTMAAPAATVFAQVNDLHKWQVWSPWSKMDPNAKITFDGPAAGVGSSMHWDGNSQVGTGTMSLTESRPNELIRFRLDFEKPFKATNTSEFTFTPQGSQTVVSWSMFGPNTFMGKAISLFMNCEKMVGDQFSKGLADLKSIVENTPKTS